MTGLTPAADVGAAAFLSPEALAQLEQETPARLAGVDLTPALAAQIREMGRAMGAQRKADLQARFEVEVQGDPDCFVTIKGWQPETVEAGLARNPGVVATAVHCVNSIPYVVAADPGIKTYLDLPLVAGRAHPDLRR